MVNFASKEKESPDKAKLSEKLFESRSIIICSEITQKVAKEVMTQLIALATASNDDITLYLNSQGGHVESGDTIHDMIRFVEPRVKIVGTGWVASAGVLIYLAVPKEDRFSLPNTRFLIHQPSGGIGGQAVDIGIEAKEIMKMKQRLNKMTAEQTGQPLEKVEQDTDRNYWMSANEAIEYGIVGKIVNSIEEIK